MRFLLNVEDMAFSRTSLGQLLVKPWQNLEEVAGEAYASTWKIGASSSLLIATMTFEAFMPTRC